MLKKKNKSDEEKVLRKAMDNFVFELIAIILIEISCMDTAEMLCELWNIRLGIGYGVIVVIGVLLTVISLHRYKEVYRSVHGGDTK